MPEEEKSALPLVLILDGSSKHVAQMWSKIGYIEKKKKWEIRLLRWCQQMILPGQMTYFTPEELPSDKSSMTLLKVLEVSR